MFENYRIPADRLIGGVEGKGLQQVLAGLELGRINVAARGVGIARAALQEAVTYAQQRKTFGKPICEHQAIQLKLGEMATQLEASRLLVESAARAFDRGERCDMEAGMAKYFATETAMENALDAMRIHGGYGYSTRVQRRALLPRRAAAADRRRHQRDAADHHREAAHREEPRMSMPLRGVRIVAVEQYGAGPFGTQQLADLGAEIIKIENPADGGDIGRAVGPHFFAPGDSHFFEAFNRNKKSMTLDLKTPGGQEVFAALVKTADATFDNLRGDLPAKLGLTYDTLGKHNPKLVCAHLSAYGRTGSRAAWPGYDYLMQAEAGYLSVTGEPDGPPARFGLSIVDLMTGVTAALGLLAGIIDARASGKGRDIDVSLFDVALANLNYPGTWYLNEGTVITREPRSRASVAHAEPALPHEGRLDLRDVQQGEVLGRSSRRRSASRSGSSIARVRQLQGAPRESRAAHAGARRGPRRQRPPPTGCGASKARCPSRRCTTSRRRSRIRSWPSRAAS